MFLLEIFLKNKFSYSLETPNIKPRMGFFNWNTFAEFTEDCMYAIELGRAE